MKFLKMLGLAAIAAAALMAFVGTGTASATVLCTNTPAAGTDCSAVEAVGQVIDLSAESSLLWKTGGGTTVKTCTEGTIKGSISDAGSTTTTVKVTVASFTLGGCSTSVSVLAPGTLEIHHIAGTDNGTVTSTGLEITTKFLGVSCIAKTNNTDIGTLTGGNPATLDISATVPKNTGGLCPTSDLWSGFYKVTTPNATLHVAAG